MEEIIDTAQKNEPEVMSVDAVEESEELTVAVDSEEEADTASDDATDYAALMESDLAELRGAFPELKELNSICELKNPVRFGALRDLGLTPTEAYLASGGRKRAYDNRTHLTSTVPIGAASGADHIPRRELEVAKALFGDMSDSEIQKLYRRVTK